jgi:predicted nucleotidyltransferase component of viral defense system
MTSLLEIVRQYPAWMQRPEFHDQMVKEYIHHHMLRFVFNHKKSDKLAFLGGTALRYFYNLNRFSEDLDFDNFELQKEEFIDLTDAVLKDLRSIGYEVHIEDKERYSNLQAFRRVFVFPELKYKLGISRQKEARFIIKIESEAHGFHYAPETKILNGFGVSTPVRTVPLSIMFSTKIAAALSRSKDRDFFDVISLITFAKPDFGYLSYRCGIQDHTSLREALLAAADRRNLEQRAAYDCGHMLFSIHDIAKLRSFSSFISAFDFTAWE